MRRLATPCSLAKPEPSECLRGGTPSQAVASNEAFLMVSCWFLGSEGHLEALRAQFCLQATADELRQRRMERFG